MSGSFNAHWRRESGGGNTDQPEADRFRTPRKRGYEKLNDERGDKPLPVSSSRDGAKLEQLIQKQVRGSFCILSPEIRSQGVCKCSRAGRRGILLNGPDQVNVLTNVKA